MELSPVISELKITSPSALVIDNWDCFAEFIAPKAEPAITSVNLPFVGLGYIFILKSLPVCNVTLSIIEKFFCTLERVELWDTAFDKMQPAVLTASTR